VYVVKEQSPGAQTVTSARQRGGHSFGYFGTWVNERLTK
jgi:hypothetical protein